MSFKDKFQNWINASDEAYVEGTETEYEDDFDFAPGAEPVRQEEPVRQTNTFRGAQTFHSKQDRNPNPANVVSIAQKPAPQNRPRVVFQKIDRFEDVNKVADILKEKRIVVLNLESCPNDVAQRIIDVLYGVSYANDGDFKKVAGRAYIITPNNVPVTGELGDEVSGSSADAEF